MNRNLRLQDKSTLHERVVSRLREAILNGEFQPGERLIQEELAEAMGVSRMPIREALRQLEKEGLVTLEAHKGAIVTPITLEDIEEIYELRANLEALGLERSMRDLSRDDKNRLQQLADDMEQAVQKQNAERFIALNAEFHRMLRKGSKWRRLHNFLELLWHGFPPHTPNILPRQMDQSLLEHKEILQAIEAGDGERAKRTIQKHILRTGEALQQHFREQSSKRQSKDKPEDGDSEP